MKSTRVERRRKKIFKIVKTSFGLHTWFVSLRSTIPRQDEWEENRMTEVSIRVCGREKITRPAPKSESFGSGVRCPEPEVDGADERRRKVLHDLVVFVDRHASSSPVVNPRRPPPLRSLVHSRTLYPKADLFQVTTKDSFVLDHLGGISYSSPR